LSINLPGLGSKVINGKICFCLKVTQEEILSNFPSRRLSASFTKFSLSLSLKDGPERADDDGNNNKSGEHRDKSERNKSKEAKKISETP
jgi:hypothetical protein